MDMSRGRSPSDPQRATYSPSPGVQVILSSGTARDYLSMKAKQLAAVSRVICDEEFEAWDVETQRYLRWLAASLSGELCKLVPIAQSDRQEPPHLLSS